MRTRHAVPVLLAVLSLLAAACGGGGGGTTPAQRPPPTVVHVHDATLATSTWTSDHLYVVDALVQVTSTLTIEPGTIVKFSGAGTGLAATATGAILANGGSEATPIVFTSARDDAYWDTNGDGTTTSPAPGDWRGVSVLRSGSVFDHCRFTYGGGVATAATLSVTNGAAVRITGCTFAHDRGGTLTDLRGAAVNLAGAGVGTVFTGNTFHHDDLPLVIGGTFDVDASNVFHDPSPGGTTNRYDGVFWDGNYTTTGHRTWSSTDAPYVIASPLSVPPGASLTVADGVVVKFYAGERLEVSGALRADGGAAGIRFTSLADDAGGDSNGDGAATSPAPGDWRGVAVTAAGSVFDRCRFSYAGSAPAWATLGVAGATATITNSTFAHNAGGMADHRGAALYLGSAAAGTVVTGNTFHGNEVPVVINGVVEVDDSNLFHVDPEVSASTANTYNGIFVDGVSNTVRGTVSWTNLEVPHVIDGGTVLTVGSDADTSPGTLTLASGVVVKVGPGRIDVRQYGTLDGAGATFTSLRDDARLGDTNGDGAATTPADGDWAGIQLCTPLCAWAAWGNIHYDTVH